MSEYVEPTHSTAPSFDDIPGQEQYQEDVEVYVKLHQSLLDELL